MFNPMNLNVYLQHYRRGDLRMAPALRMKDGLFISVQATSRHYCTPREDFGPWTHVEVGFPNRELPEIMEYAENSANPTETVYGWVPVEIVEKIINDAGGVVLLESRRPETLEYAENSANPTGTVYGWVPVEITN